MVKASTVMGLLFCLTACGVDSTSVPTLNRDLSKPSAQTEIAIPLTPFELVTEADFDRFEEKHLSRIPAARQHTVYESMWQAYQEKMGVVGSDQATQVAKLKAAVQAGWGARVLILLERLALLHLKTFRQTQQGRRIIELAETLRQVAPKNPKAIFVLSYARSIFLTASSQDNTFRLDTKTRAIAQKLLTDWRQLLIIAPDYQGPYGWDAKRIQKQIKDLENALQTQQANVAKTKRKSEHQMSAQAVKTARADLWKLENTKPGRTKSICEGRMKRLARPGKSELERLADLHCAFERGDARIILDILGALAGTQTLGNVCQWVNRLDKQAPSGLGKLPSAKKLATILATRGLPPCPALSRSR